MLTKEEAKKEVQKIVKDFSEIPKQHLDTMPEEDIKFQFIEPLFESLGWERKDIQKEARVLKGRADYILKLGNQEVLVIEAKKTNVSLMEEEGRQAVSYAYHRKIKFAVLTNFKEIRVYHALSNIKNIDKNLLRIDKDYFRLNFTEFIEKFDKLWMLSKESFEKGEINKLLSAKDEKINKPIDVSILADLLKIREWLSKELKSKKTYLTQEKIDEIVQIMIDRLIFIRSVEDRGLEPMNYLKSLESDVRQQRVNLQLFPYLLEKFAEFNKKYDSKLFEQGILEKEGSFSDDVLRKVILALYFGVEGNQERYMFDIIPGDLFGSIYEQYLGTILAGTEKRVKLDSASGKRKKMGIYYTPSYIVDYIVKNTVGEYIKDKSIDELLQVRIADPACGSGSFLIRAFQEVCDRAESLMGAGKKSEKWLAFKNYSDRLSLGQKIAIMSNCIYGVDLDEKAVELARLNLLLKMLDGEDQDSKKLVLPHLGNIKCGNSLIDDPHVSNRAFNWHAQFKDVFAQGGFDVVIGNPPYVNIFNILEPDRSYFQKNYQTATNKSDLYAFFIEKILKFLVKDRGEVGLIISNTWTSIQSFESLRKMILEESEINNLVPLENGIFAEAMVVPIIITLRKSKDKEAMFRNEIALFELKQNQFNLVRKLPQEMFIKNSGHVFSFSVNLSQNSIFKKMRENAILLGDIAKFSLGIKSADNEKFVSKSKKDSLSKKVIKGRNIKRYFFEYCGEWIWYNPKEMSKRVGAGPRKPEYFEVPKKIILQEISGDKIIASLDKEEYYASDTVNMLYEITNPISMEFILGLLNSKLINFWYGSQFKGIHVKLNELKQIPIKLPTSTQEKMTELVNQMLELQKKYHDEKASGNEKDRLKQQIDNVDYEIDEEVYKLYGITAEEKKIIEESLK